MSVSSWGDLLYGLGLFAVSQPLTPASIGLFLLFVLLAAGVLVAVRVLYHSLTFLLGNAEDLAGVCSEQIITFSLYPGTIFDAPVVAVILHTLIPAALVAHLPADLFRAVARGTGLDWGCSRSSSEATPRSSRPPAPHSPWACAATNPATASAPASDEA